MAFGGEFLHSFDEKGRLSIPVKYREELGSQYKLWKGLEACVCAYPMQVWTKLEDKLNERSDFTLENRMFKRRFFSSSSGGEIDKQGRTLINQEFRNYGKLIKEVYIIGAGDHLEIWDKDTWERYRDSLDQEFETLAERFFQ